MYKHLLQEIERQQIIKKRDIVAHKNRRKCFVSANLRGEVNSYTNSLCFVRESKYRLFA